MNKNTNKTDDRNRADLNTVLKTPPGRRLLWRLLQAAQVEHHGFVPGDPYATAFHCGQRSIGLFLLGELQRASPAAYARLRGEYLSEIKSKQNQIDAQNQENEYE